MELIYDDVEIYSLIVIMIETPKVRVYDLANI